MLMNADTGRVDHDDVTVESLGDGRQKPIPDADFAPANKPIVAGGVRSIALRDVGPRRASPEAPNDPVDDLAIIYSRNATNLIRQMRRNHARFKIAQLVSAHQSLQKKL